MLPLHKTETAVNGNAIRCGIETDAIGRRVAYHFLRRHPGDLADPSRPVAEEYTRVPASEILHVRRPLEAGQLRGLPYITPALVRLHQMDRYIDAQVERQKIAAMYVGFVISEAADPATLLGAAPQPGESVETADDAPAVAVEPGQWVRLGPGEDVRMSSPPGVDNSFDSFWYRVCLELAAATGLPYSVVTGDLRQASYGSQRAGLVEFRRRMEQTQHAIFVFQLCRPVWQRWCADAVLAGAIDLPGFASRPGDFTAVKWIPPRWDWIDPLKDLQAEKLAVDAGFKARSDVIEAQGYDAEETDARINADHAREEQLGLDFAAGAGETQGARATPEQPDRAAGGSAAAGVNADAILVFDPRRRQGGGGNPHLRRNRRLRRLRQAVHRRPAGAGPGQAADAADQLAGRLELRRRRHLQRPGAPSGAQDRLGRRLRRQRRVGDRHGRRRDRHAGQHHHDDPRALRRRDRRRRRHAGDGGSARPGAAGDRQHLRRQDRARRRGDRGAAGRRNLDERAGSVRPRLRRPGGRAR